MDFFSAFDALSTSEKVAGKISSAIRNSRGHKRAILRELKENLDLLMMTRDEKVSPEKAIPRLSQKYYLSAADAGFNFKQIKRSSLKEKTTRGVLQFKKYIGWSTERLLENIYLKIRYLQNILEMGSKETRVNLNLRVEYLIRLMILVFYHITAD
jgi:hypothetical protein